MNSDGNTRQKGWNWLPILGIGCGAILLLCLIVVVVLFLWIRSTFHAVFNQTFSSTPPVRTKPYDYGYQAEAAKTTIVLPDGIGTLTYMHMLMQKGIMYGGKRAISIRFTKGKTQQWPLIYSSLMDVRVGMYWYSAKNGEGPFLCFYDATGELVLDIERREIGEIVRKNGKTFLGYYGYNDTEFSSGVECSYDAKGNVIGVRGANGKPARDVTSALSNSNRVYLGTIVRVGNKLVFHPAKGSRGKSSSVGKTLSTMH